MTHFDDHRVVTAPGTTTGSSTAETVRKTTTTTVHDERRIGDLLKELRDETADLMRKEVALARTETGENIAKAVRNIAALATGGLVAYLGLAFILVAASALLALGLDDWGMDASVASWLAPLIVGGVVALIGYALVQKAISTLRHHNLYPHKTARTLREDARWLKDKMHR